ncbi:hypothetical protein HPB49_001691 [Dermacentor silvarum]|uniref:Uncharacterized protein n=1 Tax=Dermacentor silvarum TaxID=543639 RepID=A0ACB8CJ93_DERSI|nr:hypothetical protein HPB49_001691 [Dermacentor silvarum]
MFSTGISPPPHSLTPLACRLCHGPAGYAYLRHFYWRPEQPNYPHSNAELFCCTVLGPKDREFLTRFHRNRRRPTLTRRVYDVALEMLTRHFAAPCNIRLQRHRFCERRQLQGEPITDFAIALRELAALCDFATQADENMCEQLLLQDDKLTFDHAVQIALLRGRTQREPEAFANPVHRIQQQLRDNLTTQGRREDRPNNGTR